MYFISIFYKGYDQKGRVDVQRLHFKCEINLCRLTLGCNAAKKIKQDKTKPIKQNNPQISIQNMYIVYTIYY